MKEKKPLVSVIMPVYNESEKELKESIGSVLNQTYKNFELIIIDDSGIEGKVYNFIKKFSKMDKRIKIFKNKFNMGITYGLNLAIDYARGEYIARMDGDDISIKNRIETQVKFLDSDKDIGIVGTWAEVIDEKGNKIGSLKPPIEHTDIRRIIMLINPFIHPSVMYRREVFKKIGKYNPLYNLSEDHELYFRLLRFFRGANIPQVLLKYRRRKNQTTSLKWFKSKKISLFGRFKHLDKYNHFRDYLYFLIYALSVIIPPSITIKILSKK